MEQSPSAGNQQPSISDLAWLAGFTDGEGTITLSIVNARTAKRRFVRAYWSVNNTHKRSIERVVDILKRHGVGVWVTESQVRGNRIRQWNCIVTGYAKVGKLMKLLGPYLITKKIQAELLSAYIEYHELLPNNQRKKGSTHYDGVECEVEKLLKECHRYEGSTTRHAASQLIKKLRKGIVCSA